MANTEPPGTSGELASEVNANLFETAQALFAASSVTATFQQVVDRAVITIEGCDAAGILLLVDSVLSTPVQTDAVVVEIDALQRRACEGPCVDAIAHGQPFYAEELGEDLRWPQFGPQAAARGMRSLLAVPLSTHGTLGALNLYSRYPRAFGVVDRAKGLILASLAGYACSSAQSRENDEQRIDNLQAALRTREVIGQAQGILMERERISANQAFDVLRRASQHLNLKLREVAQTLVETGERPQTGPNRP